MKTVAVVVKHMYRDFDTRIDMYEVQDDYDKELFVSDVKSRLSGHFQAIEITECISEPKKWVPPIAL